MDVGSLKKHASRFGAEGVMELACNPANFGGSFNQLVELQKHIDEIEHQKHPHRPSPRLSPETRVKRFLAFEEEMEATS